MKTSQENRGTVWENHLSALADPYRRQLLVALLERSPQDDGDIDPLNAITYTDTKTETLRTELVHSHLPKLANLGYIDWDRDRGKLNTGSNWDEIVPLLRLIHGHQDELPDGWL